MVKRWIIVIGISILLIFGCVFENIYINKAFDFLENRLQVVTTALNEDKENIDTKKNEKLIEDVHNAWHEKLKVLRCFIWHSSNKDIEIGIARAEYYIKENNYTEAMVEIQSLISYLHHYSDDFKISLSNIL